MASDPFADISDRQHRMLTDLLAEREIDPSDVQHIREGIETGELKNAAASGLITKLLQRPRKRSDFVLIRDAAANQWLSSDDSPVELDDPADRAPTPEELEAQASEMIARADELAKAAEKARQAQGSFAGV